MKEGLLFFVFDRFCPAPGIASFRRILSNGFLHVSTFSPERVGEVLKTADSRHILCSSSNTGTTVVMTSNGFPGFDVWLHGNTEDQRHAKTLLSLCCTTACNTHFPYLSLWNEPFSQKDFDILIFGGFGFDPFASFPMEPFSRRQVEIYFYILAFHHFPIF